MSLGRRRAEVRAQTREVQALRARSANDARGVAGRVRELWPWLWVGGGAVLGAVLERDLDRRPRARPGLSFSLLAALPWGVLVPLLERALRAPTSGDAAQTAASSDEGTGSP